MTFTTFAQGSYHTGPVGDNMANSIVAQLCSGCSRQYERYLSLC